VECVHVIVAPIDEPGAWIREARARYDPIAAAVPARGHTSGAKL
jgi:hypothetical protein